MTDHDVGLVGAQQTSGIVRVGDTVRRPLHSTSKFVHALLRHFEAVGSMPNASVGRGCLQAQTCHSGDEGGSCAEGVEEYVSVDLHYEPEPPDDESERHGATSTPSCAGPEIFPLGPNGRWSV